MSCSDWLERIKGRVPEQSEVREMLSGHLCRCTGYTPIVAAVMEVAQARYSVRNNESAQFKSNKEPFDA